MESNKLRMIKLTLFFFFIFPSIGLCASQIYYNFVDSGTPQTAAILSSSGNNQSNARVACLSTTCLVVYEQYDRSLDYSSIYAKRVQSNGTILDSTPISISSNTRMASFPDVAADTTGFFVVWGQIDAGSYASYIYGVRVSMAGELGSAPVKLNYNVTEYAMGANPRISWGGNYFLILYHGVTGSGSGFAKVRFWYLVNPLTLALYPKSGTYYLYVYAYDIDKYSICPMPGVSDGFVTLVHGDLPSTTGGSHMWTRPYYVYASGTTAVLSGTSTVLKEIAPYSGDPAPWGGTAGYPDGNYCVAVWQEYNQTTPVGITNSDLKIERVDQGTSQGDEQTLTDTASEERDPAIAGDGNGSMLAVWEKETGGYSEIVGKPITLNGTISPDSEIIIKTYSELIPNRSRPDIEYVDSKYIVVWQDGWDGYMPAELVIGPISGTPSN